MNTPLENEVASRFGVLRNFFRLASGDPKIAADLWGVAQFAYLDNPLPSLFKDRLFVYLSRFCEVLYCIARRVGSGWTRFSSRRFLMPASEDRTYPTIVAPPSSAWG